MHAADWTVLTLYLIGTVGIGVLLGRKVRNTSDLFAAGGSSPWWASGLSAFMTMFSANTFVVWGGMAYEHGLVAILVNLCYGIAALLAGYTVAGKWKRLGVRTPAEFVERRFGKGALHFYTWSMMIFRLVGAAGALYAIATLTVAVTSGDNTASNVEGMPPQLVTAILVFGAVVILYTMIGGLWAVLMTDVIQFIVLNIAVVFVVVLIMLDIGGLGGFIAQAPEGFLSFTSGPRYTWFFLFGWVIIHYFMIGAEFAFVQRYLCVPSPRDARRGTILFGVLYLFSPFLWLLPPLLWRVQSPIPADATDEMVRVMKEEAYIKSCKNVLPIGMVGLMMAAMFSATASLISSQLNVFSGVLTHDIYRPLRSKITEQGLLRAGRGFTLLLGTLIAGIALCIPMLGGAEKVIISITELMVVPLLAPILIGLLSKRVNVGALWCTAGICIPLGLALHFGLIKAPEHSVVGQWLFNQSKVFVGVVLPVVIVLIAHLRARGVDKHWSRIEALETRELESSAQRKVVADTSPARIVGWSMVVLGAGLTGLLPFNPSQRAILLLFSLLTISIGVAILIIAKYLNAKHTP
ncbi:MAG: Na+:solute symporter [Verrucomicrobiae bacterium]|nr:Na+:solute symporter [Verrucomicrobiae bacterium]NNJ42469.1 Na+:solute symporter [Akkermansiaceae bacterium]